MKEKNKSGIWLINFKTRKKAKFSQNELQTIINRHPCKCPVCMRIDKRFREVLE